jgi:AcrR family transcriptional regulator
MSETPTVRLSGRQAEAARNDELIREAAREVFLADPAAPISAVAERAGVGIGALYRRYRSKEELLQRLAADGLRRYIAEVETALADESDPWTAFSRFMRRSLDAGAHSLTARLAGSFSATEEMNRDGRRAYEATQQLLERAKAAGALRPDVEVGDISMLFEQLQFIRAADRERAHELRHRSLTLLLDGLHSASPTPLPGSALGWEEIRSRYER